MAEEERDDAETIEANLGVPTEALLNTFYPPLIIARRAIFYAPNF
jgi:hypothetical protein